MATKSPIRIVSAAGKQILASHAVPQSPRIPTSVIPTKQPAKALVAHPPVHMFAESLVEQGAEVLLQSKALSNRWGVPVELLEARFALSCPGLASAGAWGQTNLGATVEVELSVGKVSLTKGYVPIWLLARADNRIAESLISAGGGASSALSFFVWKFSRPFFLPKGAEITARVRHTGAVPYDLTAKVGFSGRVSSETKRTSAVPFAASFSSAAFDFLAAGSDQSPETALVNVVGDALFVDRITGRAVLNVSGIAGFGGKILLVDHGSAAVAFDGAGMITGQDLLIAMASSGGQPIVRDFTPFRALFGYEGAIETPCVLAKDEFLTVRVKKLANTDPPPGALCRVSAQIGIIGWREASL